MIVVDKPAQEPEKYYSMSHGESEIVAEVLHKIGKIAAIRVARAFAKSDLSSAIKYVRELQEC